MVTVVIPGWIFFFILLALCIIPWYFLGRFLLRKLDEIIIPWIERRYDK